MIWLVWRWRSSSLERAEICFGREVNSLLLTSSSCKFTKPDIWDGTEDILLNIRRRVASWCPEEKMDEGMTPKLLLCKESKCFVFTCASCSLILSIISLEGPSFHALFQDEPQNNSSSEFIVQVWSTKDFQMVLSEVWMTRFHFQQTWQENSNVRPSRNLKIAASISFGKSGQACKCSFSMGYCIHYKRHFTRHFTHWTICTLQCAARELWEPWTTLLYLDCWWPIFSALTLFNSSGLNLWTEGFLTNQFCQNCRTLNLHLNTIPHQ